MGCSSLLLSRGGALDGMTLADRRLCQLLIKRMWKKERKDYCPLGEGAHDLERGGVRLDWPKIPGRNS